MSTIDERVVSMRFDNRQFEQGVKTTLSSLQSLKRDMELKGAGKGLDDISRSARNFSLANIASGVDNISSKFSALGVVAVSALATIASRATATGLSVAKSLTIAPLQQGLQEYETNLNSIQTILSNTQVSGANLKDVQGALEKLNEYSDKTIYNFAQMARNVGTFTAAGVDLDTSVSAIKGIANLAALSGSNAEQASTVMYQLSQAISEGRVNLQSWNSVTNAGIGGAAFQRALAGTAVKMGKLSEGSVKLSGSMKTVTVNGKAFRNSLTPPPGGTTWLTSDVLTNTLSQFTGDLKDADLAAQGYSKTEIKAIQQMAKTAQKAATVIKTGTQLVGVLQETAQSGWAKSWQLILGDFEQAPKMWSNVNDAIGGMIQRSADARNKILGDWNKYGGRTALIEAVANSFKALMGIIKPVREAFRTIFPAITGKQLADISKSIRDFTRDFKIGGETADKIKRTFVGVFSVFRIGTEIIKGIARGFFNFLGIASGGTGGILSLTASVGDFLAKISEWAIAGKGIEKFFDKIIQGRDAVFRPLINFVELLIEAFAKLFSGDVSGFVEGLKSSFSAFAPLVETVQTNFANLLGVLSRAAGQASDFISSMGSKALAPIAAVLATISGKVEGLRNKFKNLIPDVNTSGLDGMDAKIASVSAGGSRAGSIWEGVVNAFSNVGQALGPILGKVGEFFKFLGTKIKEWISGLSFLEVVAIIDAGMFAYLYFTFNSFVKKMKGLVDDFRGVVKSVTGPFDQLKDTLKSMQNEVRANIIVKIALAVALLAFALKTLSKIDAKDLAKALGAISILLAQLTLTLKMFEKFNLVDQKGLIATGINLVLLAVAIKILASAVEQLAGLNWEELAKGLIGVGGLLGALALFTKFAKANEGAIAQGAGLILLAVAIRLLAESVAVLGAMDTGQLIKGILAMNAMLVGIAAMVAIMNNTSGIVQAAAGMLILAAALMAMSLAIKVYAAMEWGTMIKGLILMVGTLGLLGGAMNAFPPNMIATAAALVILSGALLIIAGVLKIMGNFSVEEIAKSIITLALALGIISAAVNAMTGALPGAAALLVVSAALLIFANAMKILGGISWEGLAKGMLAIVAVFVVLGLAAVVLTPVLPMLAALALTMLLLGQAMLVAGAGFALFAVGFATFAALGTAGFGVIIAGFTALLQLIPLFALQIGVAMITIAKVISEAGPTLVAAFTTLIMSMLASVEKTAPRFIQVFGDLVIKGVKKLNSMIPILAASGLKMIIALLNAINNQIPRITNIVGDMIVRFLNALKNSNDRIIRAGTDMLLSLIKGIGNSMNKLVTASVKVVTDFMDAIGREVPKIADSGAKMIISLIRGITDAINNNAGEMQAAGGELAIAIINGMTGGLLNGIGAIRDAAASVARAALDEAKSWFGIDSPSKEFEKIGRFVNKGLVKGLVGGKAEVTRSFGYLKDILRDGMKAAGEDVTRLEKKLKGLQAKAQDSRPVVAEDGSIIKNANAYYGNAKAIKETQKALYQARRELAGSTAAHTLLTKSMNDEKLRLQTLGKQHDALTVKIKKANETYLASKKVRDDFAKGVKATFNDRPDIAEDTHLITYLNELKTQIADTQKFSVDIKKLRDLGLNDTLYKELLAKGVDSLPFIQELLAGGKKAVTSVNTLGSQLNRAAGALGNKASDSMYASGQKAAAGIVAGLKKQQGAIDRQMEKIATSMVRAIKRKLGIRSPSKEFEKIAKQSVEGLSKGLFQSAGSIDRAAEEVGKHAILAMSKSIAGLSEAVDAGMDVRPVITPTLDLSDVKAASGGIGDLLATNPITLDASTIKAKSVSSSMIDVAALKNAEIGQRQPSDGIGWNFTQNNYSPKALSPIEVYRQTHNQLSAAKGAIK